MTLKDFDSFLKTKLENTDSVLSGKAKEYATGDDRFHNFNMAAQIFNLAGFRVNGGEVKNYHAAMAFQIKHLVSVIDIISGSELPTTEQIAEKFGDDRNYSILIEAMLNEKKAEWSDKQIKFANREGFNHNYLPITNEKSNEAKNKIDSSKVIIKPPVMIKEGTDK